MNLSTPISQLNRVGKTLEKRLQTLGIASVQDLLFYFPFRYEDYSQIKLIKDVKDGEQVTISGQIELLANKRSFKKRKIITEAVVVDDSDRIKVVWFGQPFIIKVLKVGDKVNLSGKVGYDMFGKQMVSPVYEKLKTSSGLRPSPSTRGRVDDSLKLETAHTARIVPMYSLTSGITQKQIRFLLSQVIDLCEEVKEWLPKEILEKGDLLPLSAALHGIHFPFDAVDLKQSERRLKFDELFILQLRAEKLRQLAKTTTAPALKFLEKEIKKFVSELPFTLTKAQKITAWEILQDLGKVQPMNRLLEGDVGSGKTIVAGMALYNTVLNGYQGVLMAPTEILARQHFDSLNKLLGKKAKIGLITRTAKELNYELRIKNQGENKENHNSLFIIHNSDIIVGTHALLSENVEFKKLGLVIVDEQHRFGVEQRKLLRMKSVSQYSPPNPSLAERGGYEPHYLSMTATPIPRSFALALYGDLDLSIINEMPLGRKLIKTRLVEPHNREKAYRFIGEQVKQGRQVFVVCPLITQKADSRKQIAESEFIEILDYNYPGGLVDEKKSVLSEYKKLSEKIFPDLKISYLHGKMKAKEKAEVMEKFRDNQINILVSTSVVEVGVDIPNASVMMIEGAECFGLAQLHQFRGRVGRAEHQSYCFLFTDSDATKALERLKLFEKTNDGFKLAEYDLHTRGPGEVYGTAQSGMENLRLATLKDEQIIKLARDLARGIDFAKYPKLLGRVEEWEEKVHLE